jgi:hypothetical protein
MTVTIKVGRRLPKSFMRRSFHKLGGLLSFQENIWLIIKQSLNLAKKKASASSNTTGIKFLMNYDYEEEDMFYKIEWILITIQGTRKQEQEEYDEAMKLYGPLGKVFKKEIPKDDNMMKHFKTKFLSPLDIEDAYKKGYGDIGDGSIANKLLEMGIITHIKIIDDYNIRDTDYSINTTQSEQVSEK